MYSRLKNFHTKINIPSKNRYGFQEKKSTIMTILEIVDKMTDATDFKSTAVGYLRT